jgi:ubiquinone biosynthesis protein
MSFIPEQLTRHARRVGEVAGILAKYGLADWLSSSGFELPKKYLVSSDGDRLTDNTRSERIRMAVAELGTTYIKLGQMLSTRGDLVGWEIADELAKLQTDVRPDAVDVTLATVAAELGKPASEVFAEFAEEPMASASIGQVHRARLHDGTDVVVKIQHPDIESRIRVDLEILLVLAEFAERSTELKRYQPARVVSEFQRTLLRELDFKREERNLQEFTGHFAKNKEVRFPSVFSEFSTGRVLTMEMLEGVSFRDADQLPNLLVSRDEIARRGAILWMDMIFRDGFYHADPHPGNLIIMRDGTLGVLDCGMVGRMDDNLREHVEELLVCVANQDGPSLARILMRLCNAGGDFDEGAFAADITDFISFYGSQPIEHFQLGNALNEIARCISRYRLVLPSALAQVLKVLIMLDGTAKLLNPKLNLIEIIGPYQHRILLRQLSPRRQFKKLSRLITEWRYVANELPGGLMRVMKELQDGKFDIHLEHRRLEPAVNRLVMGMVVSALFLGSSMLLSNKVPPLLYGHSILGLGIFLVSGALGLRLIWRIWRNE